MANIPTEHQMIQFAKRRKAERQEKILTEAEHLNRKCKALERKLVKANKRPKYINVYIVQYPYNTEVYYSLDRALDNVIQIMKDNETLFVKDYTIQAYIGDGKLENFVLLERSTQGNLDKYLDGKHGITVTRWSGDRTIVAATIYKRLVA